MEKQNQNVIEMPVVTYDNEKFIIHSHSTTTTKKQFNKEEAALLLIELYKFLNIQNIQAK